MRKARGDGLVCKQSDRERNKRKKLWFVKKHLILQERKYIMSFDKFKDTIEQGDTVILYLNVNSMHAIQVQPKIKNRKNEWVENVFQTTYGALKVQSLVGKKFGTKVALSRGWAYVLHPTPELWTLTLPHRTQIIYTPDISMIIFQLEIKPGSVVVESGV
jgi:tRNA (adenine57-N1/adenine58-N1)-methyltransferase